MCKFLYQSRWMKWDFTAFLHCNSFMAPSAPKCALQNQLKASCVLHVHVAPNTHDKNIQKLQSFEQHDTGLWRWYMYICALFTWPSACFTNLHWFLGHPNRTCMPSGAWREIIKGLIMCYSIIAPICSPSLTESCFISSQNFFALLGSCKRSFLIIKLLWLC